MISVQIAISKLARAGLIAYLSERKDPRLIIKYNANTPLVQLPLAEGFPLLASGGSPPVGLSAT